MSTDHKCSVRPYFRLRDVVFAMRPTRSATGSTSRGAIHEEAEREDSRKRTGAPALLAGLLMPKKALKELNTG